MTSLIKKLYADSKHIGGSKYLFINKINTVKRFFESEHWTTTQQYYGINGQFEFCKKISFLPQDKVLTQMVERISLPVGFVSKPTAVRGGRAAMCVLRLASAKELRQKAPETLNKSLQQDSEKPPSTSTTEKSKDWKCLNKTFNFSKVCLPSAKNVSSEFVLGWNKDARFYNKNGSKKWTTGRAVSLNSEQMDFDWLTTLLVTGCKSQLFDSVRSGFWVLWLSDVNVSKSWTIWRFSDCPACGNDVSSDFNVCVGRFLAGLWPLRRYARERFGWGFFWKRQ